MKDHLHDEQLVAYVSDELDRADATVVADHVGCARCAVTVARYRIVRDLVRADETVLPPAATIVRALSLDAPAPPPAVDEGPAGLAARPTR